MISFIPEFLRSIFPRSDSVSSSSFSEDENETEEEGCYEMSIVQKLQDLRADGASTNPEALQKWVFFLSFLTREVLKLLR